VHYVPLDADLRSADPRPSLTPARAPSLFVFPAQSNFSGVRHPLGWVRDAQRSGYQVLVDAAAFAPTSPLSLAEVPADFVALSFYKMFGYPTGVGALVARRDALRRLRREYFGGGTVDFASVQNPMARARSGAEGFEDGTPNFLAMAAVADGLGWLARIGMPAIQAHVARLTRALLERLSAVGDRIELYGPATPRERGGTVTFNVRTAGAVLPYESVEAAARTRGIAVRGGCFCNPGAAERAFSIPARRARACLRDSRFTMSRFRACLGDRPVGAVRASVGIPTTTADLDRLIDLVCELDREGSRLRAS
jgi:selenocysteine lyase/cysteine desulfurase